MTSSEPTGDVPWAPGDVRPRGLPGAPSWNWAHRRREWECPLRLGTWSGGFTGRGGEAEEALSPGHLEPLRPVGEDSTFCGCRSLITWDLEPSGAAQSLLHLHPGELTAAWIAPGDRNMTAPCPESPELGTRPTQSLESTHFRVTSFLSPKMGGR